MKDCIFSTKMLFFFLWRKIQVSFAMPNSDKSRIFQLFWPSPPHLKYIWDSDRGCGYSKSQIVWGRRTLSDRTWTVQHSCPSLNHLLEYPFGCRVWIIFVELSLVESVEVSPKFKGLRLTVGIDNEMIESAENCCQAMIEIQGFLPLLKELFVVNTPILVGLTLLWLVHHNLHFLFNQLHELDRKKHSLIRI